MIIVKVSSAQRNSVPEGIPSEGDITEISNTCYQLLLYRSPTAAHHRLMKSVTDLVKECLRLRKEKNKQPLKVLQI